MSAIKDAYSNESYGVLPPGITKIVLDNKHLIDDNLIHEAYDSVKKCSKIYLADIEFSNMIHDLIQYEKIDENIKKQLKEMNINFTKDGLITSYELNALLNKYISLTVL